NLVERFFQRIKNYRHISTRYDKLAFCFENFVLLAACVIHF
ncbi:MAG: transposase, partial [Selenomonadaceae bacterium]|nr:transposase [Selenomonadaceae bacterium]MBR4643501.1 transposase [Selenomonadaceae bacterium]